MNEVKRWAKTYLFISPIFRSHLFRQPNREAIMKINSQLTAAYALKMYKHAHYDRARALTVINNNFPNCRQYWSLLSRYLLGNAVSEVEQLPYPKKRFWDLLLQLFEKRISLESFRQLTNLYQSLVLSDQIKQFDNVVLDVSFYRLEQLSIFCALGVESAVDAIDSEAVQLLQKITDSSSIPQIFSLVLTLQRIHHKLSDYEPLLFLQEWLKPKANYRELLAKSKTHSSLVFKQSLGYLLWLVHIHELGQFVHKYTNKNYLYGQYIEQSVLNMLQLIEILEINAQASMQSLILCSEIVNRLEKGIQIRKGKVPIKKYILFEQRVRKLKDQLAGLMECRNHPEPREDNFEWLQSLNQLEIDFYSPHSKNCIKHQLSRIIRSQYFSILATGERIKILCSLNNKIGDYQDALKLREILKQESRSHPVNLVSLLELIASHSSQVQDSSLKIDNIYQLKRIKTMLQGLKVQNTPKKQIPFLQKNGNTLALLLSELNKTPEALQKQPVREQLVPLMVKFMK